MLSSGIKRDEALHNTFVDVHWDRATCSESRSNADSRRDHGHLNCTRDTFQKIFPESVHFGLMVVGIPLVSPFLMKKW